MANQQVGSWIEARPSGDTDRNWATNSGSLDGRILLIGSYALNILSPLEGRLYRSMDAGYTWQEVQPVGDANQYWNCCSVSADGKIMWAGSYLGRLWRSTDSGTTWSEIQPAGDIVQNWACCSISSDGSVILAGVDGGRLWLSKDSGANWTEQQPAGNVDKEWFNCSVNSDGSVFLAAVYAGRLYRYSKATWTEVQPCGNQDIGWDGGCSISSRGDKMLIGGEMIGLRLSLDFGDTWLEVRPGDLYTCFISANGGYILAGESQDLSLSTDLGKNWSAVLSEVSTGQSWSCSFIDFSGSVMMAGKFGGRAFVWHRQSLRIPLEELLEKRGTPGVSQVPVSFLELLELKDVLPLENTNGSSSHS